MNLKNMFIYCFLVLSHMTMAADSIRSEKIIKSDWGAVINYPVSDKKLPVIITLGGAEGGLSFTEKEAEAMAHEGFIIMRFGYFKYTKETANQKLKEIRIEKVFEAIDLIKKNPAVDSSKIALLGISKGAELALLVASKNSSIKAVIAHVPSHVVWYGLGKWKGLNKSSWTYQGKPLPFVSYSKPKSGWFTDRIAEFYEAGLETYPDKINEATILVENISGPVLLSSGGKDDIWPSSIMAKEIENRLIAKKFSFEVKHLYYPDAGHGIFGLLPDKNDTEALNSLSSGGGSSESNYKARENTWNETFLFLKKYL